MKSAAVGGRNISYKSNDASAIAAQPATVSSLIFFPRLVPDLLDVKLFLGLVFRECGRVVFLLIDLRVVCFLADIEFSYVVGFLGQSDRSDTPSMVSYPNMQASINSRCCACVRRHRSASASSRSQIYRGNCTLRATSFSSLTSFVARRTGNLTIFAESLIDLPFSHSRVFKHEGFQIGDLTPSSEYQLQ